jgi:general secretion pathway protein E
LVELGVQPFLISSSLLGVLAQRLVRQLCRKCRQPFIPTDQDLRSLDLDPSQFGPPKPLIPGQAPADSTPPPNPEGAPFDDEPTQVGKAPTADKSNDTGKPPRPVFYRAIGCQACAETGYSGRIGVFELLVIDESIRREILNNSDGKKIARVAVSRGMVSLREDGVRQVTSGRTSLEEVLAATHDAEADLE